MFSECFFRVSFTVRFPLNVRHKVKAFIYLFIFFIQHPEERLNRSQIHLNKKEFSTRILCHSLLAILHPHFWCELFSVFVVAIAITFSFLMMPYYLSLPACCCCCCLYATLKCIVLSCRSLEYTLLFNCTKSHTTYK